MRNILQLPTEADLDEIEKMQEEAMAGVTIFIIFMIIIMIIIIIIFFIMINMIIIMKVREQLMTQITGLEEQISEMKTDIRHCR